MSETGRVARVALLIATWLALSSCALIRPSLEPPDIRLRSVTLERLDVVEQVFQARLTIQNPNDTVIRVSDARLRLSLEGIYLGEGRAVEGFSVPAMGRQEADVRVVTDLLSQAPRLLNWLLSGDQQIDYRVEGYVDLGMAGFARLNIDEQGQVSLADLSRLPATTL